MRADFYLIDQPRFREQPLLLVCHLAQKALDSGQPVTILARDAAQAGELDELLWAFDADAFVAHAVATGHEPADDPVVIAAPGTAMPPRPLVINLRDAPVTDPVERVLEVVPADPASRSGSRTRWRAYQAAGATVRKIDM